MSGPIRRLAALGDVHQEDQVLGVVLEWLRDRKLDVIDCVGDVADGPGDFSRTCQLLRSAGVQTVRGNHDRWLLAGTMRDLPELVTFRMRAGCPRSRGEL